MSRSSPQSASGKDDASDLVRAARPLTVTETASIQEEARQRAGETGQEVMGESRRGRVEAEARRVSDEMTRRAQEERQRGEAEHAALTPANVPQERAAEPLPAGELPPQASTLLPRALPAAATINRVVVPVNGAAFAQRAIPYGVAVARLASAPLALVHIGDLPHEEPTAALERAATALGADSGSAAPAGVAAQSPGGGQLWEQVARHLAGIEWLALPAGPVTQGLLDLEAPDGSDLVVLAIRRHTGAEGDTLGAIARTLIRQGQAPVLVISPQVNVPAEGLPRLDRILVPLDGSALAEEALAPIMGLVSGLASARPGAELGPRASAGVREIVLFSVVESWHMMDDGYRYLNAISEALRAALPATVSVTEEVHLGSAPGAIVAAGETGGEPSDEQPRPFDLVVLATHGRGGMRRWLLGSVAEYVLTHATVPVMVVRPARVSE